MLNQRSLFSSIGHKQWLGIQLSLVESLLELEQPDLALAICAEAIQETLQFNSTVYRYVFESRYAFIQASLGNSIIIPSSVNTTHHEFMIAESAQIIGDALRMKKNYNEAKAVYQLSQRLLEQKINPDQTIYSKSHEASLLVTAKLAMIEVRENKFASSTLFSSIRDLATITSPRISQDFILAQPSCQINPEDATFYETRLEESLKRYSSINLATVYRMLGEMLLLSKRKNDDQGQRLRILGLFECSKSYNLCNSDKAFNALRRPSELATEILSTIEQDFAVCSALKDELDNPALIFEIGEIDQLHTSQVERKANTTGKDAVAYLIKEARADSPGEDSLFNAGSWTSATNSRKERALQAISRLIPEISYTPITSDPGSEVYCALWVGAKKHEQTLVIMQRDKRPKSAKSGDIKNSVVYMQFTWAMRRYIARRLHHFSKSGERGHEIVSQIVRISRNVTTVDGQEISEVMLRELEENQNLLTALLDLFNMDQPCKSCLGNKVVCSWLTKASE
jgi:tetratricopeptide (TPR) repeat protein